MNSNFSDTYSNLEEGVARELAIRTGLSQEVCKHIISPNKVVLHCNSCRKRMGMVFCDDKTCVLAPQLITLTCDQCMDKVTKVLREVELIKDE